MSELFGQLGVDFRLLIAQAVNFLIVLAVLYVVLYRPLIAVIAKRTARIAEGLANADKADAMVAEADAMKRAKIQEGEIEAVAIVQAGERSLAEIKAKRTLEAEAHIGALMERAAGRIKRDHAEAMQAFDSEATQLVKAAVVKFTELSPQSVDEALVREAVQSLRRESTHL